MFQLVSFIINKNVNIKFSVHDTFLKQPSSGTLNIKILESQIIVWEQESQRA
jgi:hypothetical protein